MYGLHNQCSIRCVLHLSSFRTKHQACNPAEASPGDLSRWVNVLHVSEIQDERHEADENKVGASNDAKKECSLSEFGTAQDHLEEHLRTSREEGHECIEPAPFKSRGILLAEGCTCQLAAMFSGSGPRLSVYHIRQHRQQGRGDQSSVKIYLTRNIFDRNIAAQGR